MQARALRTQLVGLGAGIAAMLAAQAPGLAQETIKIGVPTVRRNPVVNE